MERPPGVANINPCFGIGRDCGSERLGEAGFELANRSKPVPNCPWIAGQEIFVGFSSRCRRQASQT